MKAACSPQGVIAPLFFVRKDTALRSGEAEIVSRLREAAFVTSAAGLCLPAAPSSGPVVGEGHAYKDEEGKDSGAYGELG